MAFRDAYCASTDLSLGQIPLPAYISADKVVADAADEIDSKIGFLYDTPVPISDSSATPVPVKLLLKRINIALATGRLILSIDATGENKNLNAYGQSLVADAIAALDGIAAGDPVLPGVAAADGSDVPISSLPKIANVDAESTVEAFYDRIANPYYVYPSILDGQRYYGAPYPGLVR